MRKRSNASHPITHMEIERAMMSYLKRGGTISVLPQQKITAINVIGSPKWDAYESIQDLSL